MSNTTNLNLFKHDNPATNTNLFDIERALNENWDKVDTYAGNTNRTLSNKVDKVTGKGLSTNDYTNAEKQQVATNKTGISNIKTEQTTQNNRLSSLETDNTTNKANIQTNTSNITALTGRVSTNETNIATLQAKNEALEEECEALRNDLNNSTLTISGTGENVTLENTAEARFKKFVVGGNSKQETREGYNVLNISRYPYSEADSILHGATCSVNTETGVIETNASEATSAVTIKSRNINKEATNVIVIPAGIYYFEVRTDGYYSSDLNTLVQFNEGLNTLQEDYVLTQWYIPVSPGTTDSRLLQISKDKRREYEPYGVMPSPEYPSEVKTVKNNANIFVANKNLFNVWNQHFTSKGVEFTMEDNILTVNGTATGLVAPAFNLKRIIPAGTIISVSANNSQILSDSNIYLRGHNAESNTMFTLVSFTNANAKKENVSFNKDITDIQFRIPEGATLNNFVIKIQIETGANITNYATHNEQVFSVPIQDEMLNGDTFEKIDGVWKEVHSWNKIVDNGTQSAWTQNTVYPNIFMRKLEDMISKKELFEGFKSNKFKYQGIVTSSTYAVDKTCYALTSSVGVISTQVFIYNSNISSLQELMNDFQNENLVLYYQPKSKRYIECTNEQKAILDQIEKTAHSYKGQTHIYSTDEISPIFDVEAVGDLNAILANQNQENS